jgi:hypothetical protein
MWAQARRIGPIGPLNLDGDNGIKESFSFSWLRTTTRKQVRLGELGMAVESLKRKASFADAGQGRGNKVDSSWLDDFSSDLA